MKGITYHIKSIIEVIKQLTAGRFFAYFIPGAIISLLYYWYYFNMADYENGETFLSSIPWVGEYLEEGFHKTVGVINFIVNQIYVFFVLTLLSPFNTLLSEKLDTRLTGQKFEGGLIRIINDLVRMIFIVVMALILEFFFILVWWIIAKMFGIPDSIYQVMSFILASFFFGFSFYDHSLERYQKGVFASLGFAFNNILLVTITGAIFHAIYSLPIVGITLSPVLTTMIATVVYLYYIGKMPHQNREKTE